MEESNSIERDYSARVPKEYSGFARRVGRPSSLLSPSCASCERFSALFRTSGFDLASGSRLPRAVSTTTRSPLVFSPGSKAALARFFYRRDNFAGFCMKISQADFLHARVSIRGLRGLAYRQTVPPPVERIAVLIYGIVIAFAFIRCKETSMTMHRDTDDGICRPDLPSARMRARRNACARARDASGLRVIGKSLPLPPPTSRRERKERARGRASSRS